jgi:hypothetical protein
VTVIDDNTLSVVVPDGAGTVDVVVQSGVYAPGNPSNIRNPIFGYGVSGTTGADLFAYDGNAPRGGSRASGRQGVPAPWNFGSAAEQPQQVVDTLRSPGQSEGNAPAQDNGREVVALATFLARRRSGAVLASPSDGLDSLDPQL